MTALDTAHDFPMIDGIPVYPIFGAEGGGFHTQGDALVTRVADGTPLDTVRHHSRPDERVE